MKHILFNILVLPALLAGAGRVTAQERLSLDAAVSLAKDRNAEIAASHLDSEISTQDRNVARSLFLPTVHISGQVNHYFERTPFFGFGADGPPDRIPYGRFGGEDQLGAAITAVQPLYNPVAGPGLKQANLNSRHSEINSALTAVEIVALVKQTYLQILVMEERLSIENESIRRNTQVLRDARSLFLQGKALRVDTLRAYTSVKNLEPRVVKLQYAIESAKLHLAALTGIDDKEIVLTDSLSVQFPATVLKENEVYEAALRDNPEFQLIRLEVEKTRQNVAVTSAARLPSLSAIGQYQIQSQANNFQFGNAYYPGASFVGVQLSLPVFTGFSTRSRTQGARLRHDQSAIREAYSQDRLKTRVHEVIALNRESVERLRTATTVTATATVSYEIIQYRYQKGIASRLELTDAEFELSTAKSNYLEAVYDYLSSEIELAKLLGESD